MAYKQKGRFLKVTKPEFVNDEKKFKKSQVVIEFTVKSKTKSFNNILAADIFGAPNDVVSKAKKIKDNFSKGDDVELTVYISSKESNKGYFPQIKYASIQHADKTEDDEWDGEESSGDNWEDSDDSFDAGSEEDLPF